MAMCLDNSIICSPKIHVGKGSSLRPAVKCPEGQNGSFQLRVAHAFARCWRSRGDLGGCPTFPRLFFP